MKESPGTGSDPQGRIGLALTPAAVDGIPSADAHEEPFHVPEPE